MIARGAHLEAIKRDGLKLIAEDGSTVQTHPKASQRMQDLGPQDVVVLGMKAHQVSAIIADLPSLYHEDTMVLTAQNGIPWWYFQKHGGPHDGLVLKSVDPDGLITKGIDPNRLIGSVVYPAGEIVAPGLIRHTEGNLFSLSEIDNQPSDRVTHLSQALREAGFKAPVSSDIRAEIWTKLWGNLAFNPISVFFCYRQDGALAAIHYEVNNTFGERHGYFLPVEEDIDPAATPMVRQSCDKHFHVSPFIGMDMRYAFRVSPPAERIALGITGSDAEGPIITAAFAARRHRLTDGALVSAFVTYPLLTLKVVASILWEALLLWLKGTGLYEHPNPPSHPVTIVHAGAS